MRHADDDGLDAEAGDHDTKLVLFVIEAAAK
jgi:hypothetical protein